MCSLFKPETGDLTSPLGLGPLTLLCKGTDGHLSPYPQPALPDKGKVGAENVQSWLSPGLQWLRALSSHTYGPEHSWCKTDLLPVVSLFLTGCTALLLGWDKSLNCSTFSFLYCKNDFVGLL